MGVGGDAKALTGAPVRVLTRAFVRASDAMLGHQSGSPSPCWHPLQGASGAVFAHDGHAGDAGADSNQDTGDHLGSPVSHPVTSAVNWTCSSIAGHLVEVGPAVRLILGFV